MRYQLSALGTAAGMVLSGVPGLAAAATADQSSVVEDYAYPGADKILAEQGIVLKTGDGNIRLVACGDRADVIRIVSNRNSVRETFCFESDGPKGYLSLEVPATFLAKGDGSTVEMTLTNKGKSQTVPIGKDTWTKLGESADPDNGPATLVEIKTSGGTPADPGSGDAAPYIAKVTVGQPGIDGRSCSGVLVGPQWIVTSQACAPTGSGVPSSPVTATVGTTATQVVNLVPRSDRDLVLARLSTPVTSVAPVALGRTAPAAGDTVTVGGFGRTADTWVPGKATTASFTATSVSATTFALTGTAGRDTCKGDAGGPALRTRSGGGLELAGISSRSWQHGCLAVGETRAGSTEVRTDDLVDWFRAQAPDLAISCRPNVPIFAVKDDLLLYGHPNPTDGGSMGGSQSVIGNGGWSSYVRLLAGPDGLIYGIRANGDVYRYQWTGTTWTPDSRALVATGWTGFDYASNHNRITIDSRGDIYLINPDGALVRSRYNGTAKTWSTETLDTGWGDYNLVVGAGDGVLYARSTAGLLYRYAFDDATHQWTQSKHLVGNGGWNGFTRISSAGADVLYTVTTTGELRWYRYLPYSDTWAPGPTVVGNGGWGQFTDVEAERNACSLPR